MILYFFYLLIKSKLSQIMDFKKGYVNSIDKNLIYDNYLFVINNIVTGI